MSPTKTNTLGHFDTLVVDDEPTSGVSGESELMCARAPVGLLAELTPVSYTHLTLPTILLV